MIEVPSGSGTTHRLGGRGAAAVLLAIAALAAYSSVGPGFAGDLLFGAISIGACAAIFVGMHRRRPIARRAWFAVGLAVALITAGNILAAASRYEALRLVRPVADVLYMAAYLPLITAAYRFGRGMHRADRTTFLDTGIVLLAAIPLVWELVVEPRLPAGTAGVTASMALALPVIAIVLVSLAAPLLYLRSSRSASALLFVGGLAALGAGDSLYGIQMIDSGTASTMVNLAWLSSYLLIGAAALVPSAHGLGATREPTPGRRDLGRFMVLGLAILVGPLMTIHETIDDRNGDLLVMAMLALAGACLQILRFQRTLGQLASADQRFRGFMGHDRFMAVIKDSAGRYTYMNPSAQRVRRQADADWYGRTDTDLFDAELAAARTAADSKVRRDGSRLVSIIEQDGRIWHTERFALAGGGGDVGVLGVDITEHVRAEETLRAQSLEVARLGAAIDNATDAVIVTDATDLIAYVNPAFERLTGFTSDEVVGRMPSELPGGEPIGRALAEAAASPTGWRGDIVTWRRDGSDLITETSISPIVVDGGREGFVTIGRDVTRERAAGHVADRRARERALIAETLGALRAGVPLEETAHAVCEQLVKLPEVAIASLLTFGRDGIATVLEQADRDNGGTSHVPLPASRSAYLRTRAIAGPWVEHWAPEPTHPYLERFGELEIMAHAYAPIVVNGEPIGLLIAGSDSIDAIDRMAERLPALVEFAAITATLVGDAVAERVATAELAAEVHAIIDAGAFHPVFQPIVDLATGAVRGYEALTRFADGTSPDVRFEDARRLGAGIALEGACLRAILEEAEHLPHGPWLNVNVSPELVLTGMLGHVLPAGDREVVIEITEHEAISDYASFRAAVAPISDRVRIAVDDAGAGFASLRHIVELSPAMVKLDRSLIAGIDGDPAREAVAAGMVRFAQAAGLALLAEGIETREELATLRQLGVQLGQGFLLGRPASVSRAVVEFLTANPAASIAARREPRVDRTPLPASPMPTTTRRRLAILASDA